MIILLVKSNKPMGSLRYFDNGNQIDEAVGEFNEHEMTHGLMLKEV